MIVSAADFTFRELGVQFLKADAGERTDVRHFCPAHMIEVENVHVALATVNATTHKGGSDYGLTYRATVSPRLR